jgi:predicted nucleic acid-binding protein
MTFVADASMTLAWFFGDEQSAPADRVRERPLREGVCVPVHWSLEVVNALLSAKRRNRITDTELRPLMDDLQRLPDPVETQTGDATGSLTLELALEYGLASDDAASLELALRFGLPLATLDQAMARAAVSAGADLLPELS